MQETWVRFLGWEDRLEKGMATHSGILAWRTPRTEEPGGLQPIALQESDMASWLNHHHSPVSYRHTLHFLREINTQIMKICECNTLHTCESVYSLVPWSLWLRKRHSVVFPLMQVSSRVQPVLADGDEFWWLTREKRLGLDAFHLPLKISCVLLVHENRWTASFAPVEAVHWWPFLKALCYPLIWLQEIIKKIFT